MHPSPVLSLLLVHLGLVVAAQNAVADKTPVSAVFYSPEESLSKVATEAEAPGREKRDLNERIRQHMSEQPQRMHNYTSCDTCRKMHMDMKQASLDHIKNYVLSFLGYTASGPPKRSGSWPKIPEYIWDQYHASQGSGYSTSPGEEWEEEREYHQAQQKYLNMQPGGGGGDSGHGYMADDPNWNLRMQQDEEPSFSPVVKTHRIYLFPNVTKFRHQQHDLMSFEFPDTMSKRKRKHNNNNGNDQSAAAAVNALNPLLYLDVSRAVLHATFHNEHINPALLDELRVAHSERKSPFTVTVHRLIAKDHQNPASEKFSKEEVSIELSAQMLDALFAPKNATTTTGKEGSSKGRKMVQLDITQMVKEWYKYPKKNHGLLLTTDPPRLRNLIYTKQADHKPFLELWTESTRKKRVKRDMSMTCKEGDFERRCCMYPLKVDFDLFGWDFIIAPKQYEANYCAGECTINFLPTYTHTHVMQMATSAPACCSPKKMQPLSLLYFNRKEQVIYTKMENMIVESCGCS